MFRYVWSTRPGVHPSVLNLGVALWLLVALNRPFWQSLWQAVGGWHVGNRIHLLTLPLSVLAFVWLALETLTWGRAARPMLTVILLASAAASYFTWAFGIVFDRTMIANLVETNPAEAIELMGWRMWCWIAALGAVPALVLWRVRPKRQRLVERLLSKAIIVFGLVATLVLSVMLSLPSYAGLFRNHRNLRLMLIPTNLLGAMHSYARARLALPERLEPVGTDARLAPRADGAKPRLLLLVVGETARSANFSLNGYERPTNPWLSQESGLISLRQVHSCGTSTAVSLPCMFLDVGRRRFEGVTARRRESLLDVLQHAGVTVLWRDNNSGCKSVCDRVPTEDISTLKVPGLCGPDECWDEILLHGLQHRIDTLRGDAVIVLHMKGSHGPAYHLRVPPAFEYFEPVCRTNQLDRCTREEIVNAYDNTLRYTDHVLAQAIELLRDHAKRFDPALIYVSDHGESLGENGLYLHGLPYPIAPDEQTHVPMLLWFPASTRRSLALDDACLRRRRDEPFSHDHLAHSVLGLMGVQTVARRADLDLFSPCGMP